METIDTIRRNYMTVEKLGMTKLYNRVHDGHDYGREINQLRELHEQLDSAVCTAYGWADIDLSYDFHETEEGQRWTMSEEAREEVLARLLELNYQRHAEDVAAGIMPQRAGNRERKGACQVKAGLENISLFPAIH